MGECTDAACGGAAHDDVAGLREAGAVGQEGAEGGGGVEVAAGGVAFGRGLGLRTLPYGAVAIREEHLVPSLHEVAAGDLEGRPGIAEVLGGAEARAGALDAGLRGLARAAALHSRHG